MRLPWLLAAVLVAVALFVITERVPTVRAETKGGKAALIDPQDTRKLGYNPIWASDLALRAKSKLASVHVFDDMIVFIEHPSNDVTALSTKDGSLLWTRVLGGKTDRVLAAFRVDKKLMVNTETDVITLDPSNGAAVEYATLEQMVSAGPAVLEDLAIFGGINGKIFAHSTTTGYSKWAYKITSQVNVKPLLIGKSVFVADSKGTAVLLKASSGTLEWRTLAFGSFVALPAANNAAIFAPNLDNSLYAFNRNTGRDNWIFRATEPLAVSPAIVGNSVLVALPSKQLVCLDLWKGTEQWRIKADVRSMLSVPKGLMLVGEKQLSVIDPANGKTVQDLAVPDGVYGVYPAASGSLVIVSPRGRVGKYDPMP